MSVDGRMVSTKAGLGPSIFVQGSLVCLVGISWACLFILSSSSNVELLLFSSHSSTVHLILLALSVLIPVL